MAKQREMALVGFLQAQNCSNYVGSWRHPGSATDFLGVEYYQRMARTLEHGKFHLGFFDDRLAMPDILGHSHVEAVRNGVRVVKMDPCTILTCMGMATTHLGLGSTYSTTYYEPFHVARVFATLDLMVGGRAAWNVVTSLNSSEAQNFGEAEHPEHDLRYDRADEFMEVVLGHWDSWEDDAIVVDKETGLFAHPEKVHPLNHNGQWFRSKGPFTVPRSPQGRPVVIQAGQSGRGRDFAARWGELVFCVYSNVEMGRKAYKAFKDEVARYGRDPDGVSICPATYIIVGETKTMAEDKRAMIDKLAQPDRRAGALVGGAQFRFRVQAHGSALYRRGAEEHLRAAGAFSIGSSCSPARRTRRSAISCTIPSAAPSASIPCFCGTPKEVADQMEEWFTNCCDGFVVRGHFFAGHV